MIRRWAILATVAAASLVGCVERKLTVTSQPEGALVIIGDEEVGRTPVTIPFLWYGDYDIILRMEGRETLTTHAQLNAPWYEYPPLDLLSALAPWTYRDERYLDYTLPPRQTPTTQEVIQRAEELKQRNAEEPK